MEMKSKLANKLMWLFLLIIFGTSGVMALLATTIFNKLDVGLLNISMLISFALFAFLVFFFCYKVVYKNVINRIEKLNNSMKNVAKGNYDILIEDDHNDELSELTDSFNKMIKELKANVLLSKNFTRYVSHEFKTPLCVIRNYAELSEDCNDVNQLNNNMEIIINEVNDLNSLSKNILTLCKLDSTTLMPKEDKINVATQIREILCVFQSLWEEKELKFDLDLEEFEITSNEEFLNIVWKNLITNAIKFSNEKGKITINLFKKENQLIFKIKDEGLGIKEEDQKMIFSPFYMGDKSRNKEGSGLGLTLVKNIVEKLDGTINFESKENEWTIFNLKLPL